MYNQLTMFLSLKRQPSSEIMVDSLRRLPEQIKSVMDDFGSAQGSFALHGVRSIVINGMGGSNLGAYILQSIFRDSLTLPVAVEPGYDVPGYVGKDTLYIVSSYSGTTEEPLAAYKIAKRRGARIIVISSDADNELCHLASRDNLPHYLFDTSANPSDQPRLGLGYGVASLLFLFRALGLLRFKDKEISLILAQIKRKGNQLTKSGNDAEKLAKHLQARETIIIGGQLFEGNMRALRNQWCETGKNFGSYLVLSDLNHFALEGLSYPTSNRKRLTALFIESDLYDAKIKKRLELTKEVMKKQGIPVHSYTPSGKTALAQSFDLLQFGSWLTYRLSLLNRVDPLTVPWVDWFKKRLSAK